MQERVVPDAERPAYLAAMADRRARAAELQVHAWVFEHARDSGRFVEFLEAGSVEALTAAQQVTGMAGDPSHRWVEVHEGA
jgi:hypothetical protein